MTQNEVAEVFTELFFPYSEDKPEYEPKVKILQVATKWFSNCMKKASKYFDKCEKLNY